MQNIDILLLIMYMTPFKKRRKCLEVETNLNLSAEEGAGLSSLSRKNSGPPISWVIHTKL